MTKKILGLVSVLAVLATLGAGCGGGQKGAEEQVKEEAEKAVGEAVNAAKNVKGQFDLGQIKEWKNKGEEFTLSFQMREYGIYPEIKRTGTGRASYKITETKTVDKAGPWEAGAGKDIFAVYLEARGDTANFGMPQSLDQTGSDPSPQFYLVDKSGKKYSMQTAESGSVAREVGGESLYSFDTNSDKWGKSAAAFVVPENIPEPTLVIEKKVADGQYEYYGMKLY